MQTTDSSHWNSIIVIIHAALLDTLIYFSAKRPILIRIGSCAPYYFVEKLNFILHRETSSFVMRDLIDVSILQ